MFAWGPGENYKFVLQHPGEEPRETLATMFDYLENQPWRTSVAGPWRCLDVMGFLLSPCALPFRLSHR